MLIAGVKMATLGTGGSFTFGSLNWEDRNSPKSVPFIVRQNTLHFELCTFCEVWRFRVLPTPHVYNGVTPK